MYKLYIDDIYDEITIQPPIQPLHRNLMTFSVQLHLKTLMVNNEFMYVITNSCDLRYCTCKHKENNELILITSL